MKLIALVVALPLLMGVVGCSMFAGSVGVAPEDVPPGVASIDTGIPVDAADPTKGNYQAVDAAHIAAGSEYIDLSNPADKGVANAVWGAVSPLIPDGPWKALGPVALWFGGTWLGSKRKRQHIGSALTKAVKLDLGGAVGDVMRAEGVFHTTDDPDALMAVAKKKMAMKNAVEEAA